MWLQINQGRGWTVDGTIELFNTLKGPKKLDIGPYPPMQSRPWVEEHDKMFRWYDHWLKGIDNGVMDEPAVTVFVEGSRQQVTGAKWPPKDIEYTALYLRPRHRLSSEPEPMGVEHVGCDGFFQPPLTTTDKVEILSWSTEPFQVPTEMIGTGAAHIFAAIDQDDTNFIVRMWDESPNGQRQLITTGYLKASHRELDDRTTEGNPTTRTPARFRWSRTGSRSTSYASTHSRRPSSAATSWWLSSPTTSRSRTSTTPYCRRTPFISRSADR